MLHFAKQALLAAGERAVDGLCERLDGGVGALGQLGVFDDAKVGLDAVELRTVRRQIVEADALLLQARRRRVEGLIAMERGVVQHDDQLPRAPRDRLNDRQHVVGRQRARHRIPPQGGLVPIGQQHPKRVDPAALRVLVGDQLALAGQHPTVVHRLAGAEPALVQVGHGQLARVRPFAKRASSALAAAAWAGSWRCLPLRLVRYQPASSRRRYRRTWRGLKRMPCSGNAAASWPAVQVRACPSKVRTAASTAVRRGWSGAGPGAAWRTAPHPSAGKRRNSPPTVSAQYPRWVAMRATGQPAAESASISRRSRSAGRRVASRRSLARSVACSSVNLMRNMPEFYTIRGQELSVTCAIRQTGG